MNWALVAEEAGFASANSARTRFKQIMDKISAERGNIPLKTSSGSSVAENTNSHSSGGETAFPSRVTKPRSAKTMRKSIKFESDTESSLDE